MTQRIYDSRLHDLVDLVPLHPGHIGMYVCGPTVQSAPHIGHLRSALVYDQIRRWFQATGHRVTQIRNVTDIDDKILDNARLAQEAGGDESWWALAYRVEREFTAAYDALGVLPPTYEPRATANIAEMVALIELLISRGHAYPALDGSASVYFDTASWPEYGALTRQQLEHMEDAVDAEPQGKRNPHDFALWKATRSHEPESAAWPSPWGAGRPGWHIECSAMATRYLGESFDIHGGGLDLRFPHHENELAQSAAAGFDFAKHWVHNGLVNTGGQKMSKSLGNSLFAADLLTASRPIVLRYFLGSAHYRSVLEFSDDSLAEAAAAFARIEGFLERATQRLAEAEVLSHPARLALNPELARGLVGPLHGTAQADWVPDAFSAAMIEDFGVPQALAALHSAVRAGNTALDAADTETLIARTTEVVAMLDVLGLDPRDPQWDAVRGNGTDAPASAALDTLVSALLRERQEAREDKDFARSDAIRDRLQAAGVALEDSPHGTRWSLA